MAFPGIDSSKLNFVYLIKSDSVVGYKIGKTINLEKRLKDLNGTSTPTPFKVICAKRVLNSDTTEKDAHNYFKEYRINKLREFFDITLEQGINYFTNYIIGDWDPSPTGQRLSSIHQPNIPQKSIVKQTKNISVKQIKLEDLTDVESEYLIRLAIDLECLEIRTIKEYIHFNKIKMGYPDYLQNTMKFKAIVNSPEMGYHYVTSSNVHKIIQEINSNAPHAFIELNQQ
jgi:hypothetical protein